MVCRGGLLLCHPALDLHLEPEHEAKGEVDHRYQFESGLYVRCYPLPCPTIDADSPSAGICGVIRTIDLGGLASSNYTGQ